MLPYFILGVALLAGLLLAGRWFATADPKILARFVKWTALVVFGGLVVFFAITGRLSWALFSLPVLLPWFLRFRSLARRAKNFSRMASGGRGTGTGHASDVETRFLRMTLDHDTGEISGEVLDGPYAGRRLDAMPLGQILELLQTCWVEDQESARVLEAYLDRVHPDWRERGGEAGSFAGGVMTREEAYQILGLEPGASDDQIKAAYHRLIAGLHPDHGGSTYLAAKINQARDMLLRG